MKPERDYNGRWRIPGYWEISFSTEDDARSAAELAVGMAMSAMRKESQYRKAAARGAAKREAA